MTVMYFISYEVIKCQEKLRFLFHSVTFINIVAWSIFTKIGIDVKIPKRTNEFVRGSISHYPFPYFVLQPPF